MRNSVLPSNESQILKFLECVASDTLENCDLDSIDTLAESAHIELLPYLAFMFDVDIVGLSESEARRLILNAIEIHRYAGTLYAVKKALSVCFGEYAIKEWFSFGGKPYTFKLEVTIGTDLDQVFDAKKWIKARDMIYWAKNERSQLLGFDIKLPPAQCDIFVSAGLVYETNPQGDCVFLHRARCEIVESVAGVAEFEAHGSVLQNREYAMEIIENTAGIAEFQTQGESFMQHFANLPQITRGVATWHI